MPLDLECKKDLSFISHAFSWPGLQHQIYILPYHGTSCDNEVKQVPGLQKCIPLHCIKVECSCLLFVTCHLTLTYGHHGHVLALAEKPPPSTQGLHFTGMLCSSF